MRKADKPTKVWFAKDELYGAPEVAMHVTL